MSNATGNDKSELLEWVKGGGLLVFTALGVLLYVIFSVPATIFYDRLGTTPGEVGITYISILSGSTIGTLVILAVLLVVSFYIVSTGAYITMMLRASHDLNSLMIARRIRKLERQHNALTTAQSSKLESLKASAEARRERPAYNISFRRIAYIQGNYKRLLIVAIILILALPGVAFYQAGQVLSGSTYFGSQIGLFDYRVEPVRVLPASGSKTDNVGGLVGEQHLFLLGQTAQYVILYAPSRRQTIRIPINAVIVISNP